MVAVAVALLELLAVGAVGVGYAPMVYCMLLTLHR